MGSRVVCLLMDAIVRLCEAEPWAKDGCPMPDDLHIWLDGGSENRNYTVLCFGAWLVKEGIFKKVYFHRLLLRGHSHSDPDQLFGVGQGYLQVGRSGMKSITYVTLEDWQGAWADAFKKSAFDTGKLMHIPDRGDTPRLSMQRRMSVASRCVWQLPLTACDDLKPGDAVLAKLPDHVPANPSWTPVNYAIVASVPEAQSSADSQRYELEGYCAPCYTGKWQLWHPRCAIVPPPARMQRHTFTVPAASILLSKWKKGKKEYTVTCSACNKRVHGQVAAVDAAQKRVCIRWEDDPNHVWPDAMYWAVCVYDQLQAWVCSCPGIVVAPLPEDIRVAASVQLQHSATVPSTATTRAAGAGGRRQRSP
eukprot:jgi/Mesvir1/14547/Mv05233-RA.1